MRNHRTTLRAVLLGLALIVAATAFACRADPAVEKTELVESGNRYFAEGKYKHAIIEYRKAIEIDQKFGAARAKLAEAYVRAGDPPRALAEYVRAADLLPQDFEVQLAASRFLLAAGRFEEARTRADAALKLKPESVPALVLRGNALAGLSSFDEALKAIEQAIRLDPGRGATHAQLGILEFARGRQLESEAAFRKAVDLDPGSIDTQLSLGNFYWAIGRVEEAEKAFLDALKIRPDHEAANRALAALYFSSGKTAEAERFLLKIADSSKRPDTVLTLANYYLLVGKPKDAIARLEPLVKTKLPGAENTLARAYIAARDAAKATALVDEMLKTNQGDVDAKLLKGQLLLNEGRRDDALAIVRSAVSTTPSSVEAQFALGRLYASRGDMAAAERAFRAVVELNPRASAAQVELARLQMAMGNPGASVRTAQEAADAQPKSGAARITLARSLLAAREYDRAEREIKTLKADLPNVPEVHTLAGILAGARNDVPGARTEFERALALNADTLEALAGLVALDLKVRDLARAKARIDERVQKKPSADLLVLAARTYWASNDLAGAEQLLRRAIEVERTLLTPYAMLGQLYVQQRKLDQARVEFEAVAARQERPAAALTMSGIIYQVQGNLEAAKKRFEEVLAVDPKFAVAANNLAWILSDSGENLDKALQLAQAATSSAPDVPEMMDTLGWVYYKKQLPQLALPLFSRCVEKSPDRAVYHFHLALAHIQAGDTKRAREALQRALETRPDAPTASEIKRSLANLGPVAQSDR